MTACHIYDDYMYGPDGEQKVKVSFVLALGSSDDPFTKAETWSPDGYADPEAANEYENMINSLQVVFYTLENEYYGKVNITGYSKIDGTENEYLFTGDMWVDEEDLERDFKIMAFTNINEEITRDTDISNLTYTAIEPVTKSVPVTKAGGTEITVDNSKVKFGDLEYNSNFRIELYNPWGPTASDSPLMESDRTNFSPSNTISITFTVGGMVFQENSPTTFSGYFVYADSDWSVDNSQDTPKSFDFKGNGTYTINHSIEGDASGVNLLYIDIKDGISNYIDTENSNITVTINSIVLDGDLTDDGGAGDSGDGSDTGDTGDDGEGEGGNAGDSGDGENTDGSGDGEGGDGGTDPEPDPETPELVSAIPMWGVKTVKLSELRVEEGQTSDVVIYVLRAMAKVEVKLGEGPLSEGYTLSSMTMHNVNSSGYVLPKDAVNVQLTEALELDNCLKTTSSRTDTYSVVRGDGEDGSSLTMYVPEYDNLTVEESLTAKLKLQMKKGESVSYTPSTYIHFDVYGDDGKPTGNPYDIKRNHKYLFVINSIVVDETGLKFIVDIEDLELGGRYGFEY